MRLSRADFIRLSSIQPRHWMPALAAMTIQGVIPAPVGINDDDGRVLSSYGFLTASIHVRCGRGNPRGCPRLGRHKAYPYMIAPDVWIAINRKP